MKLKDMIGCSVQRQRATPWKLKDMIGCRVQRRRATPWNGTLMGDICEHLWLSIMMPGTERQGRTPILAWRVTKMMKALFWRGAGSTKFGSRTGLPHGRRKMKGWK